MNVLILFHLLSHFSCPQHPARLSSSPLCRSLRCRPPTITWQRMSCRTHPLLIWLIWGATWWLIPLSKWVITPVINGISRVNPLIIVCMQLPWVDLFKQAHLIPWLRQRPALSLSGLVGAEYGWEKKRVNPLIIGVISHLLSGMSHQVY